MKRKGMKIRWVLLFILVHVFSVSQAQVTDQHTLLATDFLSLLKTGQYDTAADMFDETVRGQVSPAQLGEFWKTVNIQAGTFREHYGTRTEQSHGYDIVHLDCHFEKMDLTIRIVFDTAIKIAEFFFTPVEAEKKYQPPAYDDPANYRLEEIEIVSGEYRLPGKVTFPEGKESFPLVVLVHGSGPNDMDETIGPNKIFCDLACGLANHGVATLRYDKRTKIYGEQMDGSTLTLYEETIEDAVTAIAMARKMKGVSSVVILGHSLGAFVAPRIAEQDDPPDGIIMMAGNARPLEDLVLDQVTYLLAVDGLTPEEEENIWDLQEKVRRIKEQDFTETTLNEELLLSLPPSYWLDLLTYDPVESLKRVIIPVLMLQGERDYQVTMEDFRIWKEALGEMENVTMISYPDLNHLFMEGAGKSMPAEYSKPGNIPDFTIEDIATWIKNICR